MQELPTVENPEREYQNFNPLITFSNGSPGIS
jgi:hypothetical protein